MPFPPPSLALSFPIYLSPFSLSLFSIFISLYISEAWILEYLQFIPDQKILSPVYPFDNPMWRSESKCTY